jgi:hypothetical protein
MVEVGVKGTAYGIAGRRSDKLHFRYTELDLLRRGRAVAVRGIVVECERPFEGRTVSVCEHQGGCDEFANKGSQVTPAAETKGRRASDSEEYEAIGLRRGWAAPRGETKRNKQQ